MPVYSFFQLTDQTHSKWRGRGEGSLQMRIAFREKSRYRLSEDEIINMAIDRISNDETGKLHPGEWMAIESGSGNRFMFEVEEADLYADWW